MKPEEKAAIKAGGTAAVLGGAVALVFAHPITWAALVYGTYKIGRDAYRRVQAHSTIASDQDDTSWYV